MSDIPFTVAQAAAELGYKRYVASYLDDDGIRCNDAQRDVELVAKTSEVAGNRATFQTADGRSVVIAQLFTFG